VFLDGVQAGIISPYIRAQRQWQNAREGARPMGPFAVNRFVEIRGA
jgi:hypothetical protein